jgi:hypothetical protein
VSDDRDAFGRKKGEDGLDGLGWGSSGTTTPGSMSTPTAAPTPVDPNMTTPPRPMATQSPTRRDMPVIVRDRRGGGRWIFLAVVALSMGGAIVGLVNGASTVDKIKIPTFTVPDTSSSGNTSTTTAPQSADPESSKPPKQVESLKLLTPGGLKAGLKLLERDVPGKLESFRLAPDRIDVTVVRGSKRVIAQLTPDAEAVNVITTQDDPGGGFETTDYNQIDIGAPARLIRAADERTKESRDGVNYLLFGFAGEVGWNLYYKDGKFVKGDQHGRFLAQYN